ncbi:imelysin family protein [Maricurvus nonylphenolicus]|uniref:imelysin family protein n=1 Tax=Maricurvus nonylphenolicus TaxID=1008307 RepID=UPI0036F28362
MQQVTEQQIIPGYQTFASNTQHLANSLSLYCSENLQQEQFKQAKQQWRNTMDSWQSIQAIQFGPIQENNLGWELQFWPDKKNLIAKKNKGLLLEDSELSDERLQKASVVVRGLPSLEFLLFDPKALSYGDQQRRCDLMQGIAKHLVNVTHKLHQQWQTEHAQLLMNPGTENPLYPEDKQAIAVVLDSFLSSVEVIKDRKLGQALGLKARKQHINPYLLESWRSQHSLENIRHNISAVKTLMETGGFSAYLNSQGQQALNLKITQSLETVYTDLHKTDKTLFINLGEGEAEQWQAVVKQLGPLIQLLKHDLPAALNIQLGFNNNDGD